MSKQYEKCRRLSGAHQGSDCAKPTNKPQLLKRWDNAAHHPEIKTFPHHIHDGSEDHVEGHDPVTAEELLRIVTAVDE